MEVKIKPIADRVLVKADIAKDRTESGIIVAAEKPVVGTVISKGPDALTVQVGDRIIYGKYSGTEISFENEDYLIMREDDIYAII